MLAGEGKKTRNFGPPTLRGPTLRAPPHPSGPRRVFVFQCIFSSCCSVFFKKKGGRNFETPILAKVGLAKVGQMAKVGLARVGISLAFMMSAGIGHGGLGVVWQGFAMLTELRHHQGQLVGLPMLGGLRTTPPSGLEPLLGLPGSRDHRVNGDDGDARRSDRHD